MIDLVVDSRKVKNGDTFIAIRGIDNDGHDYVESAISNGASRVIVEGGDYGVPTLIVPDTSKYLKDYLYDNYYKLISDIKLIGVTGTSGKTTTCFLTYQMLKKLGCRVAYIGTIGFYMNDKVCDLDNTTPSMYDLYSILLECKESGIEYVVMEVSSHAIDLDRIYGLKFDICGFTNISQDHLDYHKSIMDYACCKAKLFDRLRGGKYAIVNIDDDFNNLFLIDGNNNITISENCGDVTIFDIKLSNIGINVKFRYNDLVYSKFINMVGKYNIYNYIMAVFLVKSCGFGVDDILALEDIKAPSGRMSLVKYGSSAIFVDYAHKPDAVKKVIECVREFCSGNIITIIGCGGNRDRTKRPIMGRIASSSSDYVIFTNDNPRNENPNAIMDDILSGVDRDNYLVVFDRKEAIRKGISMLRDNDVLLILGKGHEDYQIVNGVKYHLDDMECVLKVIS